MVYMLWQFLMPHVGKPVSAVHGRLLGAIQEYKILYKRPPLDLSVDLTNVLAGINIDRTAGENEYRVEERTFFYKPNQGVELFEVTTESRYYEAKRMFIVSVIYWLGVLSGMRLLCFR